MSAEIRALEPTDVAALEELMAAIPEGERRFLKDDAGPAASLPRARGQRFVAIADGQLAGLVAAVPGLGWASHVAEIRLVVATAYRRRGLGRQLAHQALLAALKQDCIVAFVEVVSEQEALVEMFRDLGFVPEALLRDFVRDGTGTFHDLMVLTHDVRENWEAMRIVGLDEEID